MTSGLFQTFSYPADPLCPTAIVNPLQSNSSLTSIFNQLPLRFLLTFVTVLTLKVSLTTYTLTTKTFSLLWCEIFVFQYPNLTRHCSSVNSRDTFVMLLIYWNQIYTASEPLPLVYPTLEDKSWQIYLTTICESKCTAMSSEAKRISKKTNSYIAYECLHIKSRTKYRALPSSNQACDTRDNFTLFFVYRG